MERLDALLGVAQEAIRLARGDVQGGWWASAAVDLLAAESACRDAYAEVLVVQDVASEPAIFDRTARGAWGVGRR